MPAIIEQLPTSSDDEENVPTPPTEVHDVTPVATDTTSAAQAAPLAASASSAAEAPHAKGDEEEGGVRVVDVDRCAQLKTAGNRLFTEGNISEALTMYRRAIWCAPIKPVATRAAPGAMPKPLSAAKGDGEDADGVTGDGINSSSGGVGANAKEQDPEGGSDDKAAAEEEDTTDYTLTSQVYCNAGFCLMKLDVKEEAVQMLSEAIRHDERYAKAYVRRADCYYDMQKWSSAFGDYESYEKLDGVLDASGRARKTAAKAKVDEEMQKMIGELKNLGNKILGNFGLSTDNFKFDKDPGTGGYSMRFER